MKKGYFRTESMLRYESANLDKDGKPSIQYVEEDGPIKYTIAFALLCSWIDHGLDVYKAGQLFTPNSVTLHGLAG